MRKTLRDSSGKTLGYIHPTHVGLIERSLRNPSLKVCKAIADALGLPLAQMITEAEQITAKKRR